ncbi:37S ribosomal protein S23 mitochondrial [Lambiella insularis]|nr:37S ribosomal protein S23 mitochondrial [Lambiella insularis]
MTLGRCWSCVARPAQNGKYCLAHRYSVFPSPIVQRLGTFSTSANQPARAANPPSKGRPLNQRDGPSKRGVKTTFSTKKKKRNLESKGRPPATGERKALRKRIVLSNTNALEVSDMRDYVVELITDESLQGQVVGIPGPVVDQLRAVEAFKVSQGWSLFRRPGMLIRNETVEHGKLVQSMCRTEDKRTLRRIYVGERGSGKSTMLLQAMAIAFLKDWVVLNFPEGQDLTIGHTEYGPLAGSSPPLYHQRTYTASLLSRLARANPILSTLSVSSSHPSLPIPIQSNLSLSRLALLGAADPEIAHSIFMALWKELTSPSTSEHPRPKILLALDGLAHVMKDTAYISASFQPIHAHDLALVRFFVDYLSGAQALTNGGMVVAATSNSNDPTVPTLKFKLSQLEVAQNPSIRAPESPMQPFLTATGQQQTPVPHPSPFVRFDERVIATMGGREAAQAGDIEVQRLKGLNREEARGLMEYWAQSGMMRVTVSEELVSEKWTISGGGVVGELERGCVRIRV